jgi:hypothetical protein
VKGEDAMTHDEARARLSALIDGALEAREAEDLATHLDGCASCRAALSQLRATVSILQEVDPMHAPEGFAAAVRGRIEQLRVTRRPAWERLRAGIPRIGWSWKTAAAAAAVAMIGIFAVNVVRDAAPVYRQYADERVGRDAVGIGAPKSVAEPVPPPMFPAGNREGPAQSQPVAQAPADVTALRRVIRTGHVAIEVDKFDDAARRLLVIAEGAGGFIADSSYVDEAGTPRGTFVIRVPAARFADVLRQVEGLGIVQRRQVSGQDVTEEFVDLEARVRNLERQEARLLSFMDRATKIPDLMAIENEVSRVRGEIERLTGRLRFLANKVELATVQAEVHEKSKRQPGGFWDFNRTLARIQAAFLRTAQQILIVAEGLVAFAASLLPLALLVALGWLIARRSLGRARRAA